MADNPIVIPYYFACDTSGSMSGSAIMEVHYALYEMLEGLKAAANDSIRIALLSFDTHVTTVFSLKPLSELRPFDLSVGGLTNLGALFLHLKEQISSDIKQLKVGGHRVYRPTLIVLTDGVPTDDWRTAFHVLTSPQNSQRPNIIAVGIREVDPSFVSEIGRTAAFVADSSSGLQAQLSALTSTLASSMTTTATATRLAIPQRIPHFLDVSDKSTV